MSVYTVAIYTAVFRTGASYSRKVYELAIINLPASTGLTKVG